MTAEFIVPPSDPTRAIHIPKQVPVSVVWASGEREIVGYANLKEEEEGVIGSVNIKGDAVVDILKYGTDGFSIGYPPDFVEHHEKEKTPRWMRRKKNS